MRSALRLITTIIVAMSLVSGNRECFAACPQFAQGQPMNNGPLPPTIIGGQSIPPTATNNSVLDSSGMNSPAANSSTGSDSGTFGSGGWAAASANPPFSSPNVSNSLPQNLPVSRPASPFSVDNPQQIDQTQRQDGTTMPLAPIRNQPQPQSHQLPPFPNTAQDSNATAPANTQGNLAIDNPWRRQDSGFTNNSPASQTPTILDPNRTSLTNPNPAFSSTNGLTNNQSTFQGSQGSGLPAPGSSLPAASQPSALPWGSMNSQQGQFAMSDNRLPGDTRTANQQDLAAATQNRNAILAWVPTLTSTPFVRPDAEKGFQPLTNSLPAPQTPQGNQDPRTSTAPSENPQDLADQRNDGDTLKTNSTEESFLKIVRWWFPLSVVGNVVMGLLLYLSRANYRVLADELQDRLFRMNS